MTWGTLLTFSKFPFLFLQNEANLYNSVTVSRERDEIENEARYISPREVLWLLIPCKCIHSHNVFKWHSKLFTLTDPISPVSLAIIFSLNPIILPFPFISILTSMLFFLPAMVLLSCLPKFYSSSKTPQSKCNYLINLLSMAITGYHLTTLLRSTDLLFFLTGLFPPYFELEL